MQHKHHPAAVSLSEAPHCCSKGVERPVRSLGPRITYIQSKMPFRITGAGGPEAQRTGNGVRRYPAPPPTKVPPELMAEALAPPDPIMHGRAPVAACLGLLDLIGIPTTRVPSTYPYDFRGRALEHVPRSGLWPSRTCPSSSDLALARKFDRTPTRGQRPSSSHPAGRSLGGSSHPSNSSLAFAEAQRPKSAHALSRPPRTPPAALAQSSSERWLQQRRELGEAKEEVFIGNNLREVSELACRSLAALRIRLCAVSVYVCTCAGPMTLLSLLPCLTPLMARPSSNPRFLHPTITDANSVLPQPAPPCSVGGEPPAQRAATHRRPRRLCGGLRLR